MALPNYQGQLVNGQIPDGVDTSKYAPITPLNTGGNAAGNPFNTSTAGGKVYDANGNLQQNPTYKTVTDTDANGTKYQTTVPTSTPTGSTSSTPTGTVPPATADKVSTNASDGGIYDIKKGDTLADIAQAKGTNIQALMAANPTIKNPNLIIAGQKLNIPGAPKQNVATDTANKYQNDLHSAISKVPDTSDTSKVAAAAASVPFGEAQLPPEAQSTTNDLIGTITQQIADLNAKAPVDLLENYKQISKDLGIDDLNTEYLNTENIINGTEDDIRTEVTKAGGFMSESQVQALAASRNKSLILKANGLQQAIATKTATLNTMSGLSEDQAKMADDRVNTAVGLETELLKTQQSIQTNATDAYNKIVTNVGYKGLAGALAGDPYSQSLAEKSLGLPQGTLSNPNALSKLDTYREQTLAQGQQRINVSVMNAGTQAANSDALTLSRYATAANNVIKQLYPTNKNPIQAYNTSAQAINRIDTALTQSLDPKNKTKGPSDLDLLDAYVSIARGGQSITEAQVDTLMKSLGISAKFDVATQKITGTGILDNGTRQKIADLAHSTFAGQKDLADRAVQTINQRLSSVGIPSNFLYTSPEEIGDPTKYSGGLSIGGQNYSPGSVVGTIDGVTLTAQADGSLQGSDGNTYDSEGNEIN